MPPTLLSGLFDRLSFPLRDHLGKPYLSGSSDGGSSVFMSEGSDDKDQKKKTGAGGKGAKPSELMSGSNHSTKKGAR